MDTINVEFSPKTKVAVILSVYNRDKALPLYCSLHSLVSQTFRDILIFIRLDGPVSSSVESLLTVLGSRYNNIFISRNDINLGLSYSLNYLIETILSQYPGIQYIARMDADDICSLHRIEHQVNYLNDHPDIDILGTACREFGLYNKTIVKDSLDRLIKLNILKVTPFIHPSVMFRARVFSDGNRYPVNTVLCEDLAFWLSLSLKEYTFHNLPNILLFYRIDETTLVRRTGLKKAMSELKIRCKYLLANRDRCFINTLYIVGHFVIRLMPTPCVKIIYKLLR